jgi:glycosyltransferase involved in cell wall biosynthesis
VKTSLQSMTTCAQDLEGAREPFTRPPTRVALHVFGGIGGVQSVAQQIKRSLPKEFFTFTLVSGRPTLSVSTVRDVGTAMKSCLPDIAHVSGLQSDGLIGMLAAVLCRGCKRLLCVHGFSKDMFFATSRRRRKLVEYLLEPLTVWLADAVYCVSSYGSMQAVVRRFARRNFGVVHNCVGTLPLANTDMTGRRELGFIESDVLAICVSRLTRAKGLLVLAEAMNIVAATPGPALKLVVVGDGPDRRQIEAAFRPHLASGRVHMAGSRTDVRKLLRLCDFFVLPSLNENMSMSILEAMEARRAVVAVLAGGNPEVVQSGKTGLLVPRGDAAALADAMLQLSGSGDLRERFGRNGRRRVETHFNEERFTHNMQLLYARLLST